MGVYGDHFEILFSYPEGGPVSLVCNGQQWLWRAPRPAFWRAPTENDLGNGFAANSAIWAAVDSWQKCSDIRLLEEREDLVSIRYTFTAPAMLDLKTEVTYTVDSNSMVVQVHYFGSAGRPQLPLFGPTPAPVEQVEWTGLSGETYPDRKKGSTFGKHREIPHIPDYLVPQECGCHMDTHQTELYLSGHSLTITKADTPYAFSAIPYTPQQLSEASHVEELPTPCRTVITVYGAMRGVGGIDSWGSDVEEAYQIASDKDISFVFRIWL